MAKKTKKSSSSRPAGTERLQKVMANAGIDSRRKCEELIEQGLVRVNGKVTDELPVFVDPDKDEITVQGRKLKKPDMVYYILNKPKGVICTSSDPRGRLKAIDLVKSDERIFCVGRLDADTTGLIVLTNDSGLTNKLTHPRYELDKVYEVKIRGNIEGEEIEKIKKGVWLSEGKTGKASIRIIKRLRDETLLEMRIRQGLNRQVRRMFARLGYKVKSLKRTRIGPLNVKGVAAGSYRKLSKSEINALKKAVNK